MSNSEIEKIILSARDKFTVHECRECTYRKCCELGFGSADCLSRRVSISLMLGIEDSYFTKLLDDIEAAWKREKAEAEADALAVGGIVEAARHMPGNAAAMHEALEAYLALWNNGTMNDLDKLRRVVGNMRAALSAPARQCDVGTAEDQEARYKMTREVYHTLTLTNALRWAQTPYEAEEGAADEKPE